MEHVLFVMCLPNALSKAEVESIVGRCGPALSCRLLWSPGGNMARIEMATAESVQSAVNLLSGSTVDGHTIYACSGDSELGEELERPFASVSEPAPVAGSRVAHRVQTLERLAS